jgi:hypothetical protein
MTETAPATLDWSAVLAQAVTLDDARPLIERSANAVGDYLAEDDSHDEELLALMERRLEKPWDPETYQRVWDVWKGLLGEEGAYFVHWFFLVRDQPAREIAEEAAPPAVEQFIRRMIAMLGPELDGAFQIWQELPHAWKTINREVHYDLIRGRHQIDLVIEKLNGERVLIEGTADSILNLTRSFLITLGFVGRGDVFSPPAVIAFLDDARNVIEMLTQEEPAGQEVTTDTAAGGEAEN